VQGTRERGNKGTREPETMNRDDNFVALASKE